MKEDEKKTRAAGDSYVSKLYNPMQLLKLSVAAGAKRAYGAVIQWG
jgi:hypothetical protein